MTDKTLIPLVIASNDNYSVGIATCLYSILDKTKAFIDIYVLDDGISEKNKELIKLSLKKFDNYDITYINMEEFGLQRFPSILHYSRSTYSRYFLADICKKYDKIIYTDADVIFMGDIEEYYNISLEEYGLAAVSEETGIEYTIPWDHNYRKKLFGIDPKHRYFAAGNIIIGGDYWRKNNICEKLIQKTIEKQKDLIAPDLDVLNMVFENNYKEIGLEYCVCTHAWTQRDINEKLNEAFEHPFIIHYTGENKPWMDDTVPFIDEYLKILKNTAYYKIVLFSYFKRYMTLKMILKNLFSIKNLDNKYKILTILFMKFKIKRKQNKYK